MREKQFTDGGVLGARVLAPVMRVRREANFHRDNDRKLGGGIQGLECCELLQGIGGQGKDFRDGGEVKTRTLHKTKGSAPREFQSCLGQTPVPRGRIGHAPKSFW
jgi:hypothetical protein